MGNIKAWLEDHVILLLSGLLLVAIATIGIAWTAVAQAKWDTSVAEANTRAWLDTVRVYKGTVAGLEGELGERTRAATLMQEQLVINSDSIGELNTGLGVATRALRLSQRALSRAQVSFDSLVADIAADEDVVDSVTGDRTATFIVEGPPIEGTATVVVPPTLARSIIFQPRLFVTPFEFTYALGCTPQLDAVATFESPSWVSMTPQRGQVAPEICHGDRPTIGEGFSVSVGSLGIGLGIGGLIGAVLTSLVGS